MVVPKFSNGIIGLTPTIDAGMSFYYMSCTGTGTADYTHMNGTLLAVNLDKNKEIELEVKTCVFKVPPHANRQCQREEYDDDPDEDDPDDDDPDD